MAPHMPPHPIDLDAVVDELHRRGIHAYVEQTGGGVATIYAGPQHEEEGWGRRWACLAGPGWFNGPTWTLPVGDLDDFYVGPDDDGAQEPITVTREHTVSMVADVIVSVIRRSDDAWQFAREVAALTKDGEKLDDDGGPWAMENDDAWETLHSLIGTARVIIGESEDREHPEPEWDDEDEETTHE